MGYTFTMEALPPNLQKPQNDVWVVIGVWGRSNSHRSDFVDHVRVLIVDA